MSPVRAFADHWIACGLGLALAAGAGEARSQAPLVMTCAMTRPSTAPPGAAKPIIREERTFRIGPDRLEEWRPEDRRYGPNLCAAFGCAGNADRTEGTIGSASVTYTIGVDHRSGSGYWRSVGASGRSETQGVCRQVADPAVTAPRR